MWFDHDDLYQEGWVARLQGRSPKHGKLDALRKWMHTRRVPALFPWRRYREVAASAEEVVSAKEQIELLLRSQKVARVATLFSEGYTAREIATELGCSEGRVSQLRKELLRIIKDD